MTTDIKSASGAAVRSSPDRKSGVRRFSQFLVLLSLLVLGFLLIRPAFQTVGRSPPPQAWRNLRQISLDISNYHYRHGAFPYDERGGDYALHLLHADAAEGGWSLDASVFDSQPADKPRPEARWDRTAGRIVNSDFDYWNDPEFGRGVPTGNIFACPTVLIVERPYAGAKWLLLATSDDRIRSCKAPDGDHRQLFGNMFTREGFLIASRDLFDEWEQVGLPRGIPQTSSSSGRHDVDWIKAGDVVVNYTYQGDRLAKRVSTSPSGSVTDDVVMDDIDRITNFARTPANWRDFWPYQ